MQRIGAVQRAGGATHDLDGPGLFVIDFEQTVYVTESSRPQRDAVLHEQEATAGAGTGQDGRADRGQVLLAAATRDPGPGRPVKQFGHVLGRDPADRRFVDTGDIAGVP